MDKVVKTDKTKFIINDIELLIDPIQMSIFKEGLNYSWKTLRTKASSKIVNGNGVFHLKLNLIFTRSMFLELHRLICQTRNTPYVQIINELVGDSLGMGSDICFFTVNSLQVIPRSDSPFTVDVEMDLRYFNHKPYSSKLHYKRDFETAPHAKGGKQYTYTFDIFAEDAALKELELPGSPIARGTKRRAVNADSILRRTINKYNTTTSTPRAVDSNAYKRYSNYLQIKNLVESFTFDREALKTILDNTGVNSRQVTSLCEIPDFKKMQIINDKAIYGENGFIETTFQYNNYFTKSYSKKQNKSLRKYFDENTQGIQDLTKRRIKIEQLKSKLFKGETGKKELDFFKKDVEALKKEPELGFLNYYTGRSNVNNVFYTNEYLSIKAVSEDIFQLGVPKEACVTSFSCGFTNMFSTIPISGQEYPTHQYLGASEPVFSMNVLLPPDINGESGISRGLSDVGKNFERMRKTLLRNAKDYKIVPDAGYFSVSNFFTKLLGAYKLDMEAATLKQTNKFILRSFNLSTVEGAPGTQTLQVSFCETNSFKEEELGRVYKKGSSRPTTKRVNDLISLKRPSKNAKQPTYAPRNWNTKYFSSNIKKQDDFYYRWGRQGKKLEEVDAAEDKRAYDFCREYLDKIQEKLKGRKVIIGSSIDTPSTGKRKTASRHYAGSAVDIAVEGMTPAELAVIVSETLDGKKYGVIAYYPDQETFNSNTRKMKGFLEKNFFVHVDARHVVARYNTSGNRVTKKDEASPTDTFTVSSRQAATYHGLDIADSLNKKEAGTSVRDFYLDGDGFEAEVGYEESDVDIESSIRDSELRPRINSYITSFGDFDERLGTSEVQEFKELSDEEKDIVSSLRPNKDSVNPTLQVNIIQSSGNTEEIENTLNRQGLNYKKVGNKFYIPRSSANIAIITKDRSLKTHLTLLDNFHKVASLMLTEPPLYVDGGVEAEKKELQRIRDVLQDQKVTPILFNSFYNFIEDLDDNLERFYNKLTFAIGVGEVIAAGRSAMFGKTPLQRKVGAALAILGVGFAAVEGDRYNEINDGQDRFQICKTIISDIHTRHELGFYKDLFLETAEIEDAKLKFKVRSDEEINDFLQNVSSADAVMSIFPVLSNKIIAESPLLDEFSRASTQIKQKTKIANALGIFGEIKTRVDGESYVLKGALSETLFLGELKRYFEYIFGFPLVKGTLDEEDFFDLFKVKTARTGVKAGLYTRQYSKGEYYPYEDGKDETGRDKKAHEVRYCVSQGADGTNPVFDVPFTKGQLKQQQENKLEYLRNLKQSILDELLEFEEVQDVVGVNKEVSLFSLIEENTYPDIILPKDPAKEVNNVDLHPTFYFQNPAENEAQANRYNLRPELKKNVEDIIGRSYDFYDAMTKGLFTGAASELEVSKNQDLEYKGYSTLERFIRDNQDPAGRKLPNNTPAGANSPTSVNTSISINSLDSKKYKELFDDKKKKFETLNESFENMFGEVGSKENINKNKGYKSKEDLIQEAIGSCRGLLKPKKDIKKAFPTYRLYLIEEDSIESDKLSVYDDFYSYSGVKSFTVYSNRKMPTSTAVIQVQNISGILDGTKPEVIRDIDIDQDLTPEQELQQQASVSSIVMRPGINIQLRAGYESNPNKLDIIFTGRVTEVKNSSAGEMLEIVAQSYGMELMAKKYGLRENDPMSKKTFYNTHSLLGTLMLSEELKHFGRVKKGRLFQRGENKQLSLDVETGKNDDWVNFEVLSWTHEFFRDNYGTIIILSALASPIAGGVRRFFATSSSKFAAWGNKASGSIRRALDTALGGPANTLKNIPSFSASRLTSYILNNSIASSFATGVGKVGGFFKEAFKYGARSLVTAPYAIFNKIRDLGLNRAINEVNRAVKEAGGSPFGKPIVLDNVAFNGRIRALLGKLGAFGRFLGGSASSTQVLNARQLDDLVISRFGYSTAARRGMLSVGAVGRTTYLQAMGGGGGLFTTLAFGGGRVARNFTAVMAASYAFSFILDAYLNGLYGFGRLFKYVWEDRLNPITSKIMLEPQDDNIYPPEPSKYLVKKNEWDEFTSSLSNGAIEVSEMIVRSSLGIIGLSDSFSDDETAKVLKNRFLKSDNRLSVNKKYNNYKIQSSTIWEVLHEMSLRHPGYLYGIRKYGDGLESRVFFGVSNQRCFVKDLPPREIRLLNKIEAEVKKLSGNVFPEKKIKEILKIDRVDNQQRQTIEILDYWIQKTEERFVPYRQYHSVDSEHDIISNNLRVQSNKVANQISVTFRDDPGNTDIEEEKIYQMRGLNSIPEDRINEKGINYRNCLGQGAACRYGMGELIHSAKDMYGGEILIIGNPKINTDDICILTDDYLNMHGLFEVEGVTHMFSYETGFVTELQPKAVVFGNESYLGSISASSIAFDSYRKLIDTYTNYNQLLGDDGTIDDEKLRQVARDTLMEVFSGSDSSIYNAIYSALSIRYANLTDYARMDQKDKERLINQITDDLIKQVKGGQIFLEDVTENISPELITDLTGNATTSLSVGAALITALITRRTGVGRLLTAGGVGAASYLGLPEIVNFAGSSLKSGYLGKNIFRDLLLSQADENHIIKILPMVKDGKPLVAGGYEFIKQRHRFKEVFGNFFNPLSDAAEGFSSRIKELEEDYKMLGVSSYTGWGVRPFLISVGASAVEFISDGAISKEAFIMQKAIEADE